MVGQLGRRWVPGALVLAMGWSVGGIARAETTSDTDWTTTDTGETEGDVSVEIVAPTDGAVLEGDPAVVDVDVYATGVEGGLVHLLVDGAAVEGSCDVSGQCLFQIELALGEHDLQAQIDVEGGVLASSAIVSVTVQAHGEEAGE